MSVCHGEETGELFILVRRLWLVFMSSSGRLCVPSLIYAMAAGETLQKNANDFSPSGGVVNLPEKIALVGADARPVRPIKGRTAIVE
jgi:hypothetical protein